MNIPEPLQKVLKFLKPEVNINNPHFDFSSNTFNTINQGISYSDLKKQQPELAKSLLDYYKTEHSKSEEVGLVINRSGGFDVFEQFDILHSKDDFIRLIRNSGLESKYLTPLLNSIYLSEKVKCNNSEYEFIKQDMDDFECRVFNLYSSGWVEKLAEYCIRKEIPQRFGLELKELVDNEALVFVHRYITKESLKRHFLSVLFIKKHCILHAIGVDLNRKVKKLIQEIIEELPKDDYTLVYNKEKQKNIGYQYFVELKINKDISVQGDF